jgi:glycosyltransferase involved in cell wall biosynthesis
VRQPLRVGLVSLEPWDMVWRRNQHLAASLVGSGVVTSLIFVNPPTGGLALRARRHRPMPGIEVVTPPLVVPRRWGGHVILSSWIRRILAPIDVLWVNDAPTALAAVRPGVPAVYDVTDDWREMPQRSGDRARLVAAEDRLARTATTVVCSDVLAERWRERYGVDPAVIRNGVDPTRSGDGPRRFDEAGTHVVYVGTQHANRLDIDLIAELAVARVGTVHLIGPDCLDASVRARLDGLGVQRHGPVPAEEVPSWLSSADVLICPHLVDRFTLSLDAIKSHEYLATEKPVVATPSSGFQSLSAPGLTVVGRDGFVAAVRAAGFADSAKRTSPSTWDDRGREFGEVLCAAYDRRRGADQK